MNKFNFDYQTGKYFEDEFLKIIDYNSYSRPNGNFPFYDFEILDKDFKVVKVEVKADYYIHKTGNIAIEYECRNKPSGINITTADYWAIFEYITKTEYTLYYIPFDIIKKYIDEKKYFKHLYGGDMNASRLYLFKKDLFTEYIIKKV